MIPKFRVWCNNRNEWEKDPVFLDKQGNLFHMMRSGNLMQCRPDTHIVQFFTGLKDKNSKDIFEGDIIKVEGCYLAVIYDEKLAAFIAKNGWDDYLYALYKKAEVVGNIFETPHLLEGGPADA